MKPILVIASFVFAFLLHSAALFIAGVLELPWQLTAAFILVSTLWIFRACWIAHTTKPRRTAEEMKALYQMVCHCPQCDLYLYHTETHHGLCPTCKHPAREAHNIRFPQTTTNPDSSYRVNQ